MRDVTRDFGSLPQRVNADHDQQNQRDPGQGDPADQQNEADHRAEATRGRLKGVGEWVFIAKAWHAAVAAIIELHGRHGELVFALPPLILFAVVFLWTPPHTWALAFRYRDDYAAAGVPMLPVVSTPPRVAAQIFWYTLATVVVSLLLWPVTPTGPLYPIVAGVLGAVFLAEAVALWRRARAGAEGPQLKAMRLFHWSNTYLALLFLAVAIDPLLF